MERERERQAAFEAAAAASAQVSDNRLDDGITTFAYMVQTDQPLFLYK